MLGNGAILRKGKSICAVTGRGYPQFRKKGLNKILFLWDSLGMYRADTWSYFERAVNPSFCAAPLGAKGGVA